jgi:hypothetical protein
LFINYGTKYPFLPVLFFQIVALWVLTGGDIHLKEAATCIFTNERLCPREIYVIRVNQPT